MIRPSLELAPYVDYDNGELIISENLPKELEKEAEEYKKAYKATHSKSDLADY